MEYRVHLVIEVEQVGNGVAIQTPVAIVLVKNRQGWSAQCEAPFVETPFYRTMEEAIDAGARQVHAELQAAVIERPRILARITPESIPEGVF